MFMLVILAFTMVTSILPFKNLKRLPRIECCTFYIGNSRSSLILETPALSFLNTITVILIHENIFQNIQVWVLIRHNFKSFWGVGLESFNEFFCISISLYSPTTLFYCELE